MPSADDLRARRRAALGARLRTLRTERNLTQENLAHLAGLDRSFYVEVETAVHSVTVDRLFDVADVLGVPLADLFTDPVFQGPDG